MFGILVETVNFSAPNKEDRSHCITGDYIFVPFTFREHVKHGTRCTAFMFCATLPSRMCMFGFCSWAYRVLLWIYRPRWLWCNSLKREKIAYFLLQGYPHVAALRMRNRLVEAPLHPLHLVVGSLWLFVTEPFFSFGNYLNRRITEAQKPNMLSPPKLIKFKELYICSWQICTFCTKFLLSAVRLSAVQESCQSALLWLLLKSSSMFYLLASRAYVFITYCIQKNWV